MRNDGDTYILKQLYGYPFLDLIAEDFELKIILPEGATDIKYEIPFSVDSKRNDLTFSYLDTLGRPTVILNKKLVTDYHNQDFYVINKRIYFSKFFIDKIIYYIAYFRYLTN